MIKNLTKTTIAYELYNLNQNIKGDTSRIYGDAGNIYGNVSNISGNFAKEKRA